MESKHLRKIAVLAVAALAMAAGLMTLGGRGQVAAASTRYVDPAAAAAAPGTGCGTSAGYATIGAAVAAAVSGDTIQVCAGTYTEQVTINKSLTLVGAGAGTKTIKAPGVLVGDANGSLNIVTITGAGVVVDLSGFTIAGPGPSGCGSINTGIFVRDSANASVHDNTISTIRDQPLSGCQNGQGILVGRQAFSTTGTATITNNTVTGYQKGGIVVDNTGSSASITGNTVTGVGATSLIAQNGIQVSRGATATVAGNTVSGNECNHVSCGPDPITQSQSTGILLFLAGGGVVVGAGNTTSGNDVGIYNSTSGTTTIKNNTVNANRYEGIFLDEGNAAVTNNSVSGGNIGVADISYNGNTANSQGTLTGNIITGAGRGIQLLDETTADAAIPTMTASCNDIAGNTTFGVENTTGNLMNAKNNWWGAASGPGPVGPGSGDAVSANVDYTPWLTAVVNKQDCPPAPTPTAVPPTPIITPVSVGGISLDPQLPGSSGPSEGLLAALVAGAITTIGGAAWWARRRAARS